MWSKRNIEHTIRLCEAGLMTSAGLAEINKAQADGRWDAAYDTATDMVVPDDFLAAVSANKKALACFSTLNKTSRFIIGFRLQTAKKPETRARRMALLVEQLSNGIKP